MGQGLILHQAEAQTDTWKDSIKERDHSLWQLAVTPLLHWMGMLWQHLTRHCHQHRAVRHRDIPVGGDRHQDNQLEANSPHLSSSQQSQALEGAVFLGGPVVQLKYYENISNNESHSSLICSCMGIKLSTWLSGCVSVCLGLTHTHLNVHLPRHGPVLARPL